MKIFKSLPFYLLFVICYLSFVPSPVLAAQGTCNTPQSCSLTCPPACSDQNYLAERLDCVCVNPPPVLKIGGYSLTSPVNFTDLGEIISKLLPYVFVLSGLILFVIIVMKGLELLTSGGNPKKTESAKEGLTAAIVGFLIIIASYWLIQILEYILHINILGGP